MEVKTNELKNYVAKLELRVKELELSNQTKEEIAKEALESLEKVTNRLELERRQKVSQTIEARNMTEVEHRAELERRREESELKRENKILRAECNSHLK